MANESTTKKILETQLYRAVQAIEDTVDEEIAKIEKMDEDDLEKLRLYTELPSEREFFAACAKSPALVCHFYRSSTFRCGIVDKHLSILAPRRVECRFVKIDAEKSPFLTAKLKVRVLPTMVIVKNEKVCDMIIGFDDLGGHDDFSTEMLDWRLGVAGVVDYQGDLNSPPDFQKNQKPRNPLGRRPKKTIRGREDDSDDTDEGDE
ncbi:unnamed protein product [Dibothriocephalus latus]|uniref:Thioredoxin domain-containing protein 9 n=1 Tax=Dibothriocephalus latus TaxID=60516 RepID=A0A3P7MCR6_DIBLA|nr:unnamed protein product [Dibothriocephalus latus]